MDWAPLERLAETVHAGDTGRPPYPGGCMIRALYVQMLYGLSDPGLDEALTMVTVGEITEAKTILGRLQGKLDYGDGRKVDDEFYMHFSRRNCNYPQPKYAKWFLSQYRRWGLVTGTPDYDGVAKKVMRPDLYEEAMKEIGFAHGGLNNDKETPFDGVTFDPMGNLDAYARSFAVNSMKG